MSSSSTQQTDLQAAEMQLLFPSPVMHFDWPDSEQLNRDLCDVVRARRNGSTGTVKTNRGGWQSNADLQDWQEEPVRRLLERMTSLAREYVARQVGRDSAEFASGWKIRAWANVNERGHYNRRKGSRNDRRVQGRHHMLGKFALVVRVTVQPDQERVWLLRVVVRRQVNIQVAPLAKRRNEVGACAPSYSVRRLLAGCLHTSSPALHEPSGESRR